MPSLEREAYRLRSLIDDADAIIVGIGSGMSSAAGFNHYNRAGMARFEVRGEDVPRCPHCGWQLVPWVRDDTFLQGAAWRESLGRYERFVRERGDRGGKARYYLLTLVFHDQADSIAEAVTGYEAKLARTNLPSIPFHSEPLMNGHKDYEFLGIEQRRGTGSSKPAASGYRQFHGSAGNRLPSFGGKAGRRRGTPGDVLRAAEAEAQAEAARALISADMGPDVNSATSPVRGARNRRGCTEVANKKPPTCRRRSEA